MNAGAGPLLPAKEASELFNRIAGNIELVMRGSRDGVRKLLSAFASGGHVLIEDYPGTGKTTLAKSLAASIGARFTRVQFTPDLLPSDILGVSVFNQKEQTFEFREGPVFTSILLADEINRASPKTQSALLETMQEGSVTTGGTIHHLVQPFFVLATQNPIEQEGTYPLPEAQLDRFAVRMTIGYPPLGEEARMLAEQTTEPPLDQLEPVAQHDELVAAITAARAVHVEESINRFVVALLRHTRASDRLALGGSPRSGIALLRLAKARALVDRRDFVVPEDVMSLATPVLAHRLILAPEARATGVTVEEVVTEALEATPAPV